MLRTSLESLLRWLSTSDSLCFRFSRMSVYAARRFSRISVSNSSQRDFKLVLGSRIKKLLSCFLIGLFVLLAFLSPKESYAIYDGARQNISYSGDRCYSEVIKFDPLTANPDVTWDASNPTCAAFMGSFGVAMVAAQLLTYKICKAKNLIGYSQETSEKAQERLAVKSPTLTPASVVALLLAAKMCSARIAEAAAWSASLSASCTVPGTQVTPICAGVPAGSVPPTPGSGIISNAAASNADVTKCCVVGLIPYVATFNAFLAGLGSVYATSKNAYLNAKVCGSGWKKWEAKPDGSREYGPGDYQLCLREIFTTDKGISINCANILGVSQSYVDTLRAVDNKLEHKLYREYIYGGMEYTDDDGCSNPWNSDHALRKKYLGYTDDKQKYYMTGPSEAPVYACQRFMSGGISADTQKAYDCCVQKSQNSLCIEHMSADSYSYEHKFCSIGKLCNVGGVDFDVYESRSVANYACAKTYSVCPYNHLLGGGTEYKEFYTQSGSVASSRMKNYCQYLNHCSKRPIPPSIRTINLGGAFISSACRDLRGDSQNIYGYAMQAIPIVNTRNFSAPMAQCFKETMENVFLHKAGSSLCENANEYPDEDGNCKDGYIYKKGDDLIGESFFSKIQRKIKNVIKLGLVISVMVFGYKILLGAPNEETFNKKALLDYIVKLSLVMFFAVGTGWQFGFAKAVIGASSYLSDFSFKLDESKSESHLDGCQFPRYNYADKSDSTRFDNPSYKPGSEYLRVWDTLDCKIARALGFGPEVSVPNLIFMILGGFLTGGFGILFVVGSLFFAFILLSITVKALHMFLISTTAIVLLLYVSPITIVCAMFERTKDIFKNWRNQMLGMALQPMILFAFLGVFVSVFDMVVVGKAEFSGDGKKSQKQIICNNALTTGSVSVGGALTNPSFSSDFRYNTDSETSSIYCIFRVSDIQTMHGLEVIGIGLPMLATMNWEKIQTILKAALLMFIFSHLLNLITELAKELVGGVDISSNWGGSAAGMAKSVKGALDSVQKRGMGAAKKAGGAAKRAGGEAMRAMGDRGKKSGGDDKKVGSDSTTSSNKNNLSDFSSKDTNPPTSSSGKDGGGDSRMKSDQKSNGDKGPESEDKKPPAPAPDSTTSSQTGDSSSGSSGSGSDSSANDTQSSDSTKS